MANDKYLPSNFQINVDPAINERVVKEAWHRIQRGSALQDQLKLARWPACPSRSWRQPARRTRLQHRLQSLAVEHDMTGVSPQMRAHAIFVIDNWSEAGIAIANANDHQKQTWALNGLRTAIEMARSEKWRAAERPKPPKEKPYNYGDGAWRERWRKWASPSTGTANRSSSAMRTLFYGWLEYVAGIKPPYNRDDDRTPEPEPETPVAGPRDPRRWL